MSNILFFLCLFNLASAAFPKIVWVYWSSGFEDAPDVTKMCLKNMHHYLDGTGWEIR
jgi:hypothetical protein